MRDQTGRPPSARLLCVKPHVEGSRVLMGVLRRETLKGTGWVRWERTCLLAAGSVRPRRLCRDVVEALSKDLGC